MAFGVSSRVRNMTGQDLAGRGIAITVISLKIEFRYTDVFDQDWFGEAYFSGTARQRHTQQEGVRLAGWEAYVTQIPKPRDWGEIGNRQNA